MKCPVDQAEMEKGYLSNGSVWVKGELNKLFSGGAIFVVAYRCPNCGRVELTTKENK